MGRYLSEKYMKIVSANEIQNVNLLGLMHNLSFFFINIDMISRYRLILTYNVKHEASSPNCY